MFLDKEDCADQVMQLEESLCKLTAQRSALLESLPLPDSAPLLAMMGTRKAELAALHAGAEDQVTANQQQKQEGEAFRGLFTAVLGVIKMPHHNLQFRAPGSDIVLILAV